MIGIYDDETNFSPTLLLADAHVSKIRTVSANVSSAHIKFSKTLFSKMIQSGRNMGDLIAAIPQVMLLAGKEALKKGISLAAKLAPGLTSKAVDYIDKGINELNKKFESIISSGITLANNKIKESNSVLRKKRNFIKKELIGKVKSVITLLAKSVSLPLGLSAGMSAANAAIQKTIYG